MADTFFRIRVEYTNDSRKTAMIFGVVASDATEAVRYLVDSDLIGSDMSTFSVTPTDMIVIIPKYMVREGDLTIIDPRS